MELERRAASGSGRAEDARRARLILLLSEGHTWDEACERVPCSRGFVASWTKRFEEQRLAGLYSRHIGKVATVLTPPLEARILEAARSGPKDSTTHWSTRPSSGLLLCVCGSKWLRVGNLVSADIVASPSAVGFVQWRRVETRRAHRSNREGVVGRDS